MIEYLAFVDEIGRTIDGDYLYRFDFTLDTDTVWGDYFNVAPAAVIPNLQVDKNALSSIGKVVFPREMALAKKNFCFSMQDCIDGLIPLIFSEIDENTIERNDCPFFLRFGVSMDDVVSALKEVGVELFDIEEVERGDDSAIENLINSIDNTEMNNDDDDSAF